MGASVASNWNPYRSDALRRAWTYAAEIDQSPSAAVRYGLLLRGVNVGGRALLPMAELKRLLADAGFGNVVTSIQSGNVAVDGAAGSDADGTLARDVGALIEQHFGLSVAIVVRRHDELTEIVARNPFADRGAPPAKIGVAFANVSLPEQIGLPKGSVDELVVRGREVYLFCPNGFGRAKLPDFDRVARTPVTMRNWNTVVKLTAMTGP